MSEKIAVHVQDRAELEAVLAECGRRGIGDAGQRAAVRRYYKKYSSYRYIRVTPMPLLGFDNLMGIQERSFYSERGYKIITAAEFLGQTKAPQIGNLKPEDVTPGMLLGHTCIGCVAEEHCDFIPKPRNPAKVTSFLPAVAHNGRCNRVWFEDINGCCPLSQCYRVEEPPNKSTQDSDPHCPICRADTRCEDHTAACPKWNGYENFSARALPEDPQLLPEINRIDLKAFWSGHSKWLCC